MRATRTTNGPFKERLYFSAEELDRLCIDELQIVNLYPSTPQPVRIERFIEKRFKITPRYGNLPSGVLGFTQFGADGVEDMVISRALVEDDSDGARRCVNTTLAHEAGHCLIHAPLFVLQEETLPLFGDARDRPAPKILCKDVPISNAARSDYDGRWWEHQANLMIGALLLPRPLVEKLVEPLLVPSGVIGLRVVPENRRPAAVALVSETFDVNPIVSRIRLDVLYPQNKGPVLDVIE